MYSTQHCMDITLNFDTSKEGKKTTSTPEVDYTIVTVKCECLKEPPLIMNGSGAQKTWRYSAII